MVNNVNTIPLGEKLPTVARSAMRFRVTIRDNRSGGGGVNTSDMQVQVVNTGSAFQVISPNTAVSWASGSTQTVTWNVAGTTSAPISAANVNIFLSTDGGLTYTTTLASNVANNGSASITVPNIPTTQVRIRVQGAGNIFFDISNANFTITASAAVVTGVTSTATDGSYSAGATIPITVQFSDVVNVAGTPMLTLNAGGGAAASYASGSGTNALTFNYTVAAGQNTLDLDYASTGALLLNGGSIASGGNPASLALPTPGAAGSLGANKSIVIDTVAPTVQQYQVLYGVGRTFNTIGVSRTLPWQITGIQIVFDESIAAGSINSLTGLTNTGFSGLNTNTLTWTINTLIQGNFNTTALGTGAAALKDLAGNALGAGVDFTQAIRVLYGDFNGDSVVNSSDMTSVFNAIASAYNPFADIDGDGDMDINDVKLVRTRIGTSLR